MCKYKNKGPAAVILTENEYQQRVTSILSLNGAAPAQVTFSKHNQNVREASRGAKIMILTQRLPGTKTLRFD